MKWYHALMLGLLTVIGIEQRSHIDNLLMRFFLVALSSVVYLFLGRISEDKRERD